MKYGKENTVYVNIYNVCRFMAHALLTKFTVNDFQGWGFN